MFSAAGVAPGWVLPQAPARPGSPRLEFVDIIDIGVPKTTAAAAKAIAEMGKPQFGEFWKILKATVFFPTGGSRFALCQLVIGGGANDLFCFPFYAKPTVVTLAGSDFFAVFNGPVWAQPGEKVTIETRTQGAETIYTKLNAEFWRRL